MNPPCLQGTFSVPLHIG